MAAYNYWNTPQDPMQWPRTFKTSFQETIWRDLKNTTQLESLQSICFQPEFQQYSPEELRLADCYIRGLISQKASHTDPTPCFAQTIYTPTWAASTPPRPRRLSLSPPTKPRVRLPIIISDGTANISSVVRLQEELEEQKKELAELKQRLEIERQDAEEKLRKQLNLKKEEAIAEAESKIKVELDRERDEAVAEARRKRDGSLAVVPFNLQQAFADLPAKETRELLASNRTYRAILSGNIKAKVEENTTRIKAKLKAEYDEKLNAAIETSGGSRLSRERQNLFLADTNVYTMTTKLEAIEKMVSMDASEPVGNVWARLNFRSPPTSNTSMAIAGPQTPPPASALTGFQKTSSQYNGSFNFGPPLERAGPIFESGGGNSLQPTFAFGRPSFPVAGEKREREAGDFGGEIEKLKKARGNETDVQK